MLGEGEKTSKHQAHYVPKNNGGGSGSHGANIEILVANVGTIKATSDSDLAFDRSSVILTSLLGETKGEVTSVDEMEKEMMKVATSVSRC